MKRLERLYCKWLGGEWVSLLGPTWLVLVKVTYLFVGFPLRGLSRVSMMCLMYGFFLLFSLAILLNLFLFVLMNFNMENIFNNKLFVGLYIDDILVCSIDLKQHFEHLALFHAKIFKISNIWNFSLMFLNIKEKVLCSNSSKKT